jgi:adenylate kinase
MTLRVLLLAPPGAGKGTQAERLASHFGMKHISTGDLFRAHVQAGTALGEQVKEYLARGDLVPDDIVMSIIGQAVSDAIRETGGYLLDGFPRNLEQARAGYHLAKDLGATVDAVLHYDAPEDELVRRLLARGAQTGRNDDNEATIRHRLDVYRTKTAPLIDYYRGRGVLVTIDADQPADEVTTQSIAALEAVRAAQSGGPDPNGPVHAVGEVAREVAGKQE